MSKDLGVLVTDKFSLFQHIAKAATKTTNVFGIIKRTFFAY